MWTFTAMTLGILAFGSVCWVLFALFTGKQLLPKSTALSQLNNKNGFRFLGAVAAVIILAWLWWYLGNKAIVEYSTAYWMWVLGAVIVGYLVLKERGLAKFAFGLAMMAAFVWGVGNLFSTGSVLPNGCSDETVVVQTKETSSDGGTFALTPGCAVTLDVDLLRLQAMKEGKAEFQPHVVRTSDNPEAVMSQKEAHLFRVSQIKWVSGRPVMRVFPNQEGFQKAKLDSIELVAFLPSEETETTKSSRAMALFGKTS